MGQLPLHDWREPIAARPLALAFLSAAGEPMRAAALIERARILGVEAAAVRMALGRLRREGMVRLVARGHYAIGASAQALHEKARGWAQAEARVRPWGGRWLVVLVEHLGRSDRRALRLRERALRLHGFARAPAGAWVRPDNLAAPPDAVRATLNALGLEPQALLMADALVPDEAADTFRALWPAARLEAGYRHWIEEMRASLARVPAMPLEAAARETLLLGQSVLRAINADPLLPKELTDAALRREMVEQMIAYDAVGQRLWRQIG